MSSRKKRVFVVDDDPMTRALLNEFLIHASFEVDMLPGGKEALHLLQTVVPDIVLLDVNMPGMDGFDVLREIRANPQTKQVPVIFLTGSDLDTDKVIEALDLDPSDFLTKLVSSKELVARILWVLRRIAPTIRNYIPAGA